MRRFLVEVVIDTVLLAVIVLFFGVISINQPFPFGPNSAPIVALRGAGIIGFATWAAVLVLVNRFARPVLVALFGRLLFTTLGLFVVIINAIAIWITSVIAPIKIGIVADPVFLWIIVGAALYTALSTVVEAVLGLNRPDLSADRSRGIWGFLERLPTPRRNAIIENLRLQQVYSAIYTTSLDIALADTPVGDVRRWFARRVLGETPDLTDETAPARIRQMLQQLGPTYVKIGQMMASRSDILPPEWIEELSKLQSDAAPFAYEDVVATIVKELGKPPEELYQTFDPVPFAAASTAQVHEARLMDGTLVAVKVQRPRIVAKTQADLGVAQQLAGVAEQRLAIARKIGLQGIVREFAQGVLKELDYRNEAYYAKRLADGMQRFPQIHVPIVYDELSGQRVKTEEFIHGIKISKADEIRAAGFDTTELGTVFIRAIIKQVLIDGFFHGDPHPGNVFVVAGDGPDRVPRPGPRRPADVTAARRPARADLLDQGDRHPGDRRRPPRARQADPRLRRGGVPRRHRPACPPVPRVRQGLVARGRARCLPRCGLQQRVAARQPADAGDEGGHPGRGDGPRAVVRYRPGRCGGDRGPGRPARIVHARQDPEAGPGQRGPDRQGARSTAPVARERHPQLARPVQQGQVRGRGGHEGASRSRSRA